eukprot:360210-Rhodomonas_salina.2
MATVKITDTVSRRHERGRGGVDVGAELACAGAAPVGRTRKPQRHESWRAWFAASLEERV